MSDSTFLRSLVLTALVLSPRPPPGSRPRLKLGTVNFL
jgi:hypothetical protein